MKIEFFEDCVPPKTTKQVSGRRKYDKPQVKLAQAFWRAIWRRHKPKEPLQGAIKLELSICWPRLKNRSQKGLSVEPMTSKPDLDNLLKIPFDAAKKEGVIIDDAPLAELHLRKFRGPIPGISIRLATWEEVL